jgi:hypothetical protein
MVWPVAARGGRKWRKVAPSSSGLWEGIRGATRS